MWRPTMVTINNKNYSIRLNMQHPCCTQKWIRHQWRISPENLALLWELALKLRQTTPRAWYDSQLPIAGVARGGAHDKRTQLANYEDLPQCFSRSRLRPLWGLHSFHILFIWCSLWLIHCLSRLKNIFWSAAGMAEPGGGREKVHAPQTQFWQIK